MEELVFIIWLVVFIIGTALFNGVAWTSIQEGQWLHSLGWGKLLGKLEQSKSIIASKILTKALGGCLYCFGHFVAFTSFILFASIFILSGKWISTAWMITDVLLFIAIYFVYVGSATTLGFINVTKWMVKDNNVEKNLNGNNSDVKIEIEDYD